MEGDLSREDLERLYLPPTHFVIVDVPEMKYFMIDGKGSPDAKPFKTAVRWLWAVVHPVRRVAKERMGKSFVEPPLEGLWWSDDPADLGAANKAKLSWRMMIPTAEWVNDEMLAEAEQAETCPEKAGGQAPSRRARHRRQRHVRL